MLVFTLEPFKHDLSSEEQIATTFTLYTQEIDSATGQINEHVINTATYRQPDDIYKYVYSDMLEPNQTYYIRARRHFASSNLDHNTPPKIVKYDKAKSEALIFHKENIVEKPYAIFNEKEFNNKEIPHFTLTGPSFKATSSGHESTHWIVRDGTGLVLFKSLYDKINKTSIQVPKDQIMLSRSKLTLNVIYVSSVGIESEVASAVIDLSKFNFEVTSPLQEVYAGEPYKLTLRRLTGMDTMGVKKVEVVDLNSNLPAYTVENRKEDEELSFVIPAHLIRANSTVKIIITALDQHNNLEHYTLYVYTEENRIREIEDDAYVYENIYEEVARRKDTDYSDYCISMEIPSGLVDEGSYIPLPVNGSDDLHKFKYQDGRLVNTGRVLNGVKLLSTIGNYTFIKYTENHLLVIDGWRNLGNGESDPVLLVYRHNTYHDTYDLISMIHHPNYDKNTAAKNGSLVQRNEYQFLYMPLGRGEIYVFDILTSTCELLATCPSKKKGPDVYSSFAKFPKQRLLIQSGDEGFMWKYEIMKDEFDKSISLAPYTFTRPGTIPVLLPNGDALWYKTQRLENDQDGQVLTYSYKDRGFRVARGRFKNGEYPNGHILLRDNQLIFTRRVKDANDEDVFITYKYK